MADDVIIELGSTAAERPSDTAGPQQGDRRIVKIVETAWKTWAPCIWRSPTPVTHDGHVGRWCIILADKGEIPGTKPQTGCMFIPDFVWEKLPTNVVEW